MPRCILAAKRREEQGRRERERAADAFLGLYHRVVYLRPSTPRHIVAEWEAKGNRVETRHAPFPWY